VGGVGVPETGDFTRTQMTALIIRLVLMAACVFGISYGVSKAFKSWRLTNRGAIKGIQRELLALREGRKRGLYDDDEFDHLTQQIHAKCEAAGIEIPNGER